MKNPMKLLSLFLLLLPSAAIAQTPIFELTFDTNLTGQQGEIPVSATNVSLVSSDNGMAALFGMNSQLVFGSQNNINSQVGTIDFLITPNWNGNDSITHEFLVWDSIPADNGGGIVFSKDGANNLRQIYNRFSQDGQPEIGSSINVASSWIAGETHHVAYSWDTNQQRIRQYVDGEIVADTTWDGTQRISRRFTDNVVSATFVQPSTFSFLPTITRPDFRIGGNLDGTLDELRIFEEELTLSQISSRFSSLTAVPEPNSLIVLPFIALLLVRRSR